MGYERNYRSTSTEAVAQITMNKVYGWMALALVISTVAAVFTVKSDVMFNLIYGNPIAIWVLIIAEFALVIGVSASINRISFGTAAALLALYAALNGVMLSSVLIFYAKTVIYTAFFSTALTFAGMSAIGYFTKKDLSSIGSYLLMGLIGVIIATVVNIFLASSVLDAIITYVGLFIFVGLTAYDTQKIKRVLDLQGAGFGDVRKLALMGALNLYLDFVNLFLYILRLFGNRR